MFAAAYAASSARPFGTTIEIGVWLLARACRASRTSNSPTANATRYDGSGGVRCERHLLHAVAGVAPRARRACWRTRACRAGTDQREPPRRPCGRARRSTGTRAARRRGSNCVTAYQRAASSLPEEADRADAIDGRRCSRATRRASPAGSTLANLMPITSSLPVIRAPGTLLGLRAADHGRRVAERERSSR